MGNSFRGKYLDRITSIELVTTEKCQNACQYCYRVRKHNRSPVDMVPPERVRIALERLFMDFPELEDVERYELFGGDGLLDYAHTIQIFEILAQYENVKSLVIPTNARLVYVLSPPDLDRLITGWPFKVQLSISVDGLSQRPLSKIGRMLNYPERMSLRRLLRLAAKYGWGFHPMLHFRNADKWLEQVAMFLSLGITPYLLEVRHPISQQQAYDGLVSLIAVRRFVDEHYPDFRRNFNTICASRTPRGLGCSALTTFTIMPNGDIPFCHRLVDPPFTYGNIFTGEFDWSRAIIHNSFEHQNHPACIPCPIRIHCSGTCLGANYEYWRGNPWAPIPSICHYIRMKYYAFSQLFDDWRNFGMDIPALRQRLEEDNLLALAEKAIEEGQRVSIQLPDPESVDDIFVS